MTTVRRMPIDHLPDDELAIQLWELTMAGERGSDAFLQLDAEIRRRNSPHCALRLATVTPSAPVSGAPVFPVPFVTGLPRRLN